MKNKKSSSKTHHEENFQIRYVDLIRIIDANDTKRFQQLADKVDLNALQAGNKPFIFHAIQKNDLELIEILLEQEIDLNTKHLIDLNMESNDENVNLKEMKPTEYASLLNRSEAFSLIESKLNEPSLEERWLKIIKTLDIELIENFSLKFKRSNCKKDLFNLGLIKASELGSNRLIDFFLNLEDVDINCLRILNGIKVTPLLHAIANKKYETAKYLIFRKADIHSKGEYGDALVTAVHYESSNDLITLILEKGASLASRHSHWPSLNLREYCIQMNKIQAKLAIDNFVFKLIANGEYLKLKNLADNGYININITNQFRKTGRDLAVERSHINIVKLIDKIEEKQKKLKTKMNY